NYVTTGANLWFKFFATGQSTALRLAKPLNNFPAPAAQLQSAKLFSGNAENNITEIGLWESSVDQSGTTAINIYYTALNPADPYYLHVNTSSDACNSFSITAVTPAIAGRCGDECD